MNLKQFFSYLIVYLLLLFKAGFYFVGALSRYTNLLLLVLVFVYVVYYNRRIVKTAVYFVAFTLLCEIITFLFTGLPEIEFILSCVISLLIVVLIVSALGEEDFKYIFSNLNLVICICSLACFVLRAINIPLYQSFPLLLNSHGDGGYFALFSIPRIEFSAWSYYRIQGIYWEPGAFQFFIIVSAVIDIYNSYLSKKGKFFRLLIYIITLFLTFSTTGIIGGLIVLLLCVYRLRKISRIPLLVFVISILAVVTYGLIDENSFLYYSLFTKIDNLTSSFIYGDISDESAEARMNSIVYVLDEFLKSPVVGIGMAGNDSLVNKGVSMTTFTPLNLFAFYGLFLGIIHVWGLIRVMKLRRKPLFEAFIVLLVLTLSTVSEQFAFNPILMCFSMYGYMSPCNNSDIE